MVWQGMASQDLGQAAAPRANQLVLVAQVSPCHTAGRQRVDDRGGPWRARRAGRRPPPYIM